MLKARSRLSRDEFPKTGPTRVFRGATLSMRVHKAETTKVAVVISKKTIKKAHERHILKRRIYAIVKEYMSVISACSIIIFPSGNAMLLNHKSLKQEVEGLIKQVK